MIILLFQIGIGSVLIFGLEWYARLDEAFDLSVVVNAHRAASLLARRSNGHKMSLNFICSHLIRIIQSDLEFLELQGRISLSQAIGSSETFGCLDYFYVGCGLDDDAFGAVVLFLIHHRKPIDPFVSSFWSHANFHSGG